MHRMLRFLLNHNNLLETELNSLNLTQPLPLKMRELKITDSYADTLSKDFLVF